MQEADSTARACEATIEHLEEDLESMKGKLLEAQENAAARAEQLAKSQGELLDVKKELQTISVERQQKESSGSALKDSQGRPSDYEAADVDLERGVEVADVSLSELKALKEENAALQKSISALNRAHNKGPTSQVSCW